jgi:ABC-type nitrate/sulfonate/bicarbonate transport system ATPase subunit
MRDIELRKVSLSFDRPGGEPPNCVYQNFDLKIEAGSFTVLLGPSGCGKSTLLNVTNGLLKPTSADAIFVDGLDVRENPDLTRKMGYIFQGPRLLPWKTLRGNVEFSLRGLKVKPKEQWGDLIAKYFDLVGLTDYLDYYPHQVSGGMQQRAAIVRAWANEPEILLMDEPFSHLDEITAAGLRRELSRLWSHESQRRTIVFVTHNISEAVQLSTDVVVLTRSPATVCHRVSIDLPWPRLADSDEVIDIEKDLRRVFAEKAGIQL